MLNSINDKGRLTGYKLNPFSLFIKDKIGKKKNIQIATNFAELWSTSTYYNKLKPVYIVRAPWGL